jgi:hypothetical protein
MKTLHGQIPDAIPRSDIRNQAKMGGHIHERILGLTTPEHGVVEIRDGQIHALKVFPGAFQFGNLCVSELAGIGEDAIPVIACWRRHFAHGGQPKTPSRRSGMGTRADPANG